MSQTMQAVRIHEFGSADVLTLETVDRPAPGPGEVLVRVAAAGVNPVDWKIREGGGRDLPAILGWDVSGTVEAVGEGVETPAVGTEVYSRPDISRDGTYAEYVVIAADELAPKPSSIDHVHAAAVPLAALTAWQGLFDHGQLEPGQRVLVHGGAGGVGHFAIQFARHIGAEVTTTGSEGSRPLVERLGVDRFVDYTEENAADHGPYDLVLDTIGGETMRASLAAVREGGRLVTIAGQPDEDAGAHRSVTALRFMVQPAAQQLGRIGELLDAGDVEVVVEETWPLAEVAEAHRRSEQGHVHGKLVLTLE